MRSACALLALWMAGTSLSAFAAGPAPSPRAEASRSHDCCCHACPGPGLCPCDPGSAGGQACVRSSDDVPQRMTSLPGLGLIKLTCEVPSSDDSPALQARLSVPSAIPHFPVLLSAQEKVPIRPA